MRTAFCILKVAMMGAGAGAIALLLLANVAGQQIIDFTPGGDVLRMLQMSIALGIAVALFLYALNDFIKGKRS